MTNLPKNPTLTECAAFLAGISMEEFHRQCQTEGRAIPASVKKDVFDDATARAEAMMPKAKGTEAVMDQAIQLIFQDAEAKRALS